MGRCFPPTPISSRGGGMRPSGPIHARLFDRSGDDPVAFRLRRARGAGSGRGAAWQGHHRRRNRRGGWRPIFRARHAARWAGPMSRSSARRRSRRATPPISAGFPHSSLALAAIVARALPQRRSIGQAAIFGGRSNVLLAGPVLLESRLVFVDITPAIFMVLLVGAVLLRRRLVVRGLVNRCPTCPTSTPCAPTAAGATRR